MIVSGTVFAVTYAALSLALRIPELPAIITVMSDLLRRRS
jgi:hypothetical protein